MFGIGGSELVAIILIALLVLGPERIPGVARSLARLYKEFTKVRKQADSAVQDIKKELKLDEALLDDDADESPRIRPPQGERAERPRLSLDQAAIVEQLEAEERAAAAEADPTGPAQPRPYTADSLPVPELDDYLGAAGSSEERR